MDTEPVEASESDEGFYDGSRIELVSSIYETIYKYGRHYPATSKDQYPWPADEIDKERQAEQFLLFCKLFQSRLSPTPASPPRAVLDLRTGVGHWAIEFADRNPHSLVYGIDLVHMQEEWVPVNCQFLIDDLTKQDWHTPFYNIDIIHIGALGGDCQLLTCLMDGAYRCCVPGGVVEIWDTMIWLQESGEKTGLHHFYHNMHNAYQRSGRFLDLPLLYSREFRRHGFINVVDHVYNIPLDPTCPNPLARAIVKNWANGFESYSLELFDKELQKHCLDSLLDCATARQALRKGVNGFLQVRVTSGLKPATNN